MNRPRGLSDRSSVKRIKGAILILSALMIFLLIGFGALALDGGYVYVVRNELQNAADAGALAGAGSLFAGESEAMAKAAEIVALNKADGVFLTDADVQIGYWDMTGAVPGLRVISNPGPNDAKAVRVVISKAAGQNGGPVQLFFGGLLGFTTMDVSAEAVAVVGSPGEINPGNVFPFALSEEIYNTYWDSDEGRPLIDSSTGNPYTFQIQQTENEGQWTSFLEDSNAASAIAELVNNGNPSALSVGDEIWIQTGAKTSIYADVPNNIDVIVPVVPSVSSGTQPIIGFGAMHIDFGVGGADKYIQGRFLSNYTIVEVEEYGGGHYGVYGRPKLAK
jgi:hypothetical protein